jgi:hypothetical protein
MSPDAKCGFCIFWFPETDSDTQSQNRQERLEVARQFEEEAIKSLNPEAYQKWKNAAEIFNEKTAYGKRYCQDDVGYGAQSSTPCLTGCFKPRN